MAAFTKFNVLPLDLATKQHNLNADALKVMLSNVAPVATNATTADITEIAAGFGYTAGGNAAAFVSGAQTAGLYRLILAVVDFIAAGGNIAPFRYAVLYNSANNKLIGFWDYGVAVIITNGNKFELQTDQVNGVLTLT
jgi:hypothetical protein